MLHEDVRKGVAWRGEDGCCMGRYHFIKVLMFIAQ